MRDGQPHGWATGIAWDLPDRDHRAAPSETELWAHASPAGMIAAGWLRLAACTDHDPELFFPLSPADTVTCGRALAVCSGCAVRADCLEAALADPRTAGVWGGTTEEERAALRARTGQRP